MHYLLCFLAFLPLFLYLTKLCVKYRFAPENVYISCSMNKFVITTRNFPPDHGGIQSLVYDIASSLNHHGEVVVFADSASSDKTFDAKQDFKVLRARGFRSLRSYLKTVSLKGYFNSHKEVSVILADHWKSLDTIPKSTNATIICLIHGKDINHKSGTNLHSRMIQALAKTRWIISNSRFTTKLAIEKGIPSHKIKTINPGVIFDDSVEAKEMERASHIFGDTDLKFISITRLVRRKSIDKTLLALKMLKEEGVTFRYVIAGEGEEKKHIEHVIKENGLEKDVVVLGAVDTNLKRALLKQSDVFLMPSVQDKKSVEGFGIAFIEAAMFGNVCVGGNVGGAADAIKEGITGVLCDGSDVNSIYDAIKTVTNSSKLESMQREAKKFVREFTWETQIKKYLDLID